MAKTSPATDQADKLRKIVRSLREKSDSIMDRAVQKSKNRARLIAVTSGKGGVGKTSITVNLAIQLCRSGYRVVIIDGDLGLANVEVIMGIVPKYSMYDLINSKLDLSDILVEGPAGIKFISGGTGMIELADLGRQEFDRILCTMSALDNYADFILIDTGAGISSGVTSFVLAAREVILVTSPEPTSITDAYAVLKVISQNNANCSVKLILNMVEGRREAEDVLGRLNTAAEKFLGTGIKGLGYLVRDPAVGRAIRMQTPFVVAFPNCAAARGIGRIAARILDNTEYQVESEGIKNFLSRIYKSLIAP
ncbi:MAG TPA: MinD/ParA family protein [Clostridia bacterium]|nr:MinD/ParA family protein [Clostridia bacterium]